VISENLAKQYHKRFAKYKWFQAFSFFGTRKLFNNIPRGTNLSVYQY